MKIHYYIIREQFYQKEFKANTSTTEQQLTYNKEGHEKRKIMNTLIQRHAIVFLSWMVGYFKHLNRALTVMMYLTILADWMADAPMSGE